MYIGHGKRISHILWANSAAHPLWIVSYWGWGVRNPKGSHASLLQREQQNPPALGLSGLQFMNVPVKMACCQKVTQVIVPCMITA